MARNQHAGRVPIENRLWSKVIIDTKEGACWLWTGAKTGIGYGAIKKPGGIGRLLTHRVALELALGRPLRDGEQANHICDEPACVRNDDSGVYVLNGVSYLRFGHLFVGGPAVNMTDRAA